MNNLETKNNIIKLSFFNPLNGEMPVFYERSLNSNFSIELGLGITKWAPILIGSMLCKNEFQGLPIEKSKIGIYASPSLRFYPFGKNKGLLLSTSMMYKRFNYTLVNADNQLINAFQKDIDRLRLSVGYSEHWSQFVGEIELGVAQRNTSRFPNNWEGDFNEQAQNRIIGFVNCKIGYKF